MSTTRSPTTPDITVATPSSTIRGEMANPPEKLPVPQITKFHDNPGQPAIPVKQWMSIFDHYLTMTDANRVNKLTSAEKNSFLYMHLGMEGCRIIQANPVFTRMSTETWGNFRQAVIRQFAPPTNPVKSQYEFMNRRQEPSETIDEFITALRMMAADCEFGDGESERLAMQLIVGCQDTKARQLCLRLLQINLDEIINILRTEELADTANKAVSGGPGTTTVAKLQRKQTRRQQNKDRPKDNDKKGCYGCGNQTHKFRDEACPARGQVCNFCHAPDHFSKVCIKRQKQQQGTRPCVKTTIGVTGHRDRVHTEVEVGDGHNFQKITMEVDSGADTSMIRESMFKVKFPNTTLRTGTEKVQNYDQTPIKGIRGTFKATVRLFGRTHTDTLHVVPDRYSNIIGQNFLKPLDILVHCKNQGIVDGRILTEITENKLHSTTTTTDWPGRVIPQEFPGLLDDNIGTFPDYQHRIDMKPGAKPTVCKPRPVPLARRQAVADEIDLMEKQGIWEKATSSDWIHPMVTVPKPDGKIRITTDLSSLNQWVRPVHHPIPNTKDIFMELTNAKHFSKLDLKKGYFHVALDPESRNLTTTATHKGLFRYKRLPMGLKDSAQAFQRCVAQTLAGIPGVEAYIDDILVYGGTQEEHDRSLREVLRRLHENGFRLNITKCRFRVSRVHFLGHIIENGKISPDPKNVEPIQSAAEPSNKKEVQVFLGMITYYADFLEDISNIAEPLRALTRKDTHFKWTKECQLSFDTLKRMAGDKLSLHIFDTSADTIVTTDASDTGIGAVLSQIQGRKEVPIAFASHTLSPTERRYATNEREALACVWAVENWEKFLLGRHFLLRTDHSALTTLLKTHSSKRASSKFTRWLDRLSAFDYTPVYHSGNQNKVADALSRLVNKAASYGIHRISQGITRDKLAEDTAQDPTLQKLREYITTHWPKKQQLPPDIQPFFQLRAQLQYKDGLILKEKRILVPPTLQRTVLDLGHEGHPGIVRMKRKLRESYWWCGMDVQTERYVQNCGACQRSQKSTTHHVPTTDIPSPTTPATHYGLDISGPYYNDLSIVALVDYYSKFPEILITRKTTSDVIITWLDGIFARYGLPDKITTDNGPQFISHSFESFLELRDILHIKTSIYNPQENGLVEAFNKPLKTAVQTLTDDGLPFEQGINTFLAHFRATAPTPVSQSPAEKFLGHKNRLRCQPSNRERKVKDLPKKTDGATPTPTTRPKLIRHSLYKKGDKVIVKLPQVRKGMPPYSKPMVVKEVIGFYTFILDDGKKHNARRLKRWIMEQPTPIDGGPQLQTRPRRVSTRTTKGQAPQRFDPC